jgi:hypothetical protein
MNSDRLKRLNKLVDLHGLAVVARNLNITEQHIARNLMTGKNEINVVKLAAAERRLNKS